MLCVEVTFIYLFIFFFLLYFVRIVYASGRNKIIIIYLMVYVFVVEKAVGVSNVRSMTAGLVMVNM